MSTMKSVSSLGVVLKKPKILRKHLSRYSWLPDVLRVEGSIATRILGPVLTVTLFATGVACAFDRGYPVTLSNSVTPLLAVVVGLILVFRNSTSYDRYYEGRKDFASMTSAIRNLTRLLWVNVSVPPADNTPAPPGKGKTAGSNLTSSQLRKRKTEIAKLAVSFAYAVKNHLREEAGLTHEDYTDILPASFARLAFDEVGYERTYVSPVSMSSSYASTLKNSGTWWNPMAKNDAAKAKSEDSAPTTAPDTPTQSRLASRKNTGTGTDPRTPLLSENHRTVEFHAYADQMSTPLPLLIAHEISRAIFHFRRDGYLETVGPAGVNSMNQLVQSMIDQLTAMERVANTPIPISYGIHLKQCVSLYLFSLPFTLVRDLGWSTIPVVTVVAFTLMGIEGIANEIEMPFGKDEVDLPLDRYCAQLKEEIDFMLERLPEGGEGGYGYDDGEGDD